MVDSRLVAHEGHAARAHAFRFQCTPDAAVVDANAALGGGDGRCLEFPPTAEPILQVRKSRLILLWWISIKIFWYFFSVNTRQLDAHRIGYIVSFRPFKNESQDGSLSVGMSRRIVSVIQVIKGNCFIRTRLKNENYLAAFDC